MIRAIAAALILLTATPALALEDADYSSAVAKTAKTAIIPDYQAFGRAAKLMQTRLEALCKTPDNDTLRSARYQFAALATGWGRVQYISFGPIFEHQRAFRIEYWPDKRNVVGRQLAEVLKKQEHAALEPDRFATTTVGVQGLPALERMLFGDDALSELKGPGAAFRCGLFAAISNNLETIARDVVAGWTEGDNAFLARIEHPSEDDEELPSGRDAAGRLLNDLLTTTIAMRDMKLLAPLGTSLEKAKPQQAEYWRSEQTVTALKANIEGLRRQFNTGLGEMLLNMPDGRVHALKMKVAFEVLVNDTEMLRNLTFERALADPAGREKIKEIADHLAQVRDLIANQVAPTLNLPIGFNALDGD